MSDHESLTREHTVQVPVLLIERAKNALLQVPPSSANADIYGDLSALLAPAPTADTILIDDPVAGQIEQRVKSRTRPPEPSQEQTERFIAIAKRFPPTAALEKVWDEGWQSGWANRHQDVPDADGTVGLPRPIGNPYRVMGVFENAEASPTNRKNER
jgi:hypothetical protein